MNGKNIAVIYSVHDFHYLKTKFMVIIKVKQK